MHSKRMKLHKIGMSSNLSGRIAAIKSSIPDVQIVMLIEFDNRQRALFSERFFHKRFDQVRKHGEWFNLISIELYAILQCAKTQLGGKPLYGDDLANAQKSKSKQYSRK